MHPLISKKIAEMNVVRYSFVPDYIFVSIFSDQSKKGVFVCFDDPIWVVLDNRTGENIVNEFKNDLKCIEFVRSLHVIYN